MSNHPGLQPFKFTSMRSRAFVQASLWLCLTLISLLVWMAPFASAQSYSGSITGVVTDPSGAVVPGAKVILTDVGKGFTYPTETDPLGRYVLRSLPPSSYKLTVEGSGFNTHVQDGIVLNVGQNATVDVALKLGTETQTIEVQEAASVLSTQDAVTGQELNRSFINDLPLVGRSVFDLAYLTPGIHQVSGGVTGGGIQNNFISNGGRNATADILIDGVTTTNFEQEAGIQISLYAPSVDAVQEFKVQQSNFSAEIGFSGATVINMVTRSGSNQFHGSLFEFLRNNVLTANDWFANASGTKLADRRYNLFGGTVGGPIRKNKTFFFFDFEGTRDKQAGTYRAGVPSARMREGNFGEICSAGFDATGMCQDPDGEGQLWDPYSGVYDPDEGGPVRSRFIPFNDMKAYQSPGNPKLEGTGYQLPARPGNLIDPVAYKMLQYYPLPNLDVGTAKYDRFNNWIGAASSPYNNNQMDIKIDHSFSEKDRLSAKFSRLWSNSHLPNCYGNAGDACNNGPNAEAVHLFSLNHTHTFNPKTLLSFTYGFTRRYGWTGKGSLTEYPDVDPIKTLGMPEYIMRAGVPSLPGVYVSDYGQPGPVNAIGTQPWGTYRNGNETHQLLASLSRLAGQHELKFGGEVRMHRMGMIIAGAPGGVFAYDRTSTTQLSSSGGGDAMASFLTGVGVPGGWGEYQVPIQPSTQSFQYAGFVQDNLRVTDKLTLNLGLRYDLDLSRTERYNRMSYFDPGAASPLQVPGLPNLRGGLQFANPNMRTIFDTDGNNFGPRFGFAYHLKGKMVLRGGYGLFYSTTRRGASGTDTEGWSGFSQETNWYTSYKNDGATPWGRLSDPWPIVGPDYPPGSSLGLMTNVGTGGFRSPVRTNIATPYEQTWTFGVQHELPGGVIIDANYVGKKGTKLFFGGGGNINHLGPEVEGLSRDQISALNEYVPNPFFGIITSGGLSSEEVSAFQLQRPFPQFEDFSVGEPPIANSIYHAFQFRGEKRFSQGLQFLITYTASKSIDDASITSGDLGWLGGTTSLQDPNRRYLERSLSEFDIPQVLQFSYVYELPIGRGKHLGTNWNPWLSGILGGWKTTGVWRFSSGQPIALSLAEGKSLPTYGGQRPNLTATLRRNTGSDFLDQYFANPEVAVVPEPYALGTAPRTLPNLRRPGTNLANLSLFKEFSLSRFREGMRLEYRAEAFNALNHPHFCGPDAIIDGGSFGKITGMCSPPREVQMALKFYW